MGVLCLLHPQICGKPGKSAGKDGETPTNREGLVAHPPIYIIQLCIIFQLCPDADFSKELGGTFDKESWYKDRMSGNLGTMGGDQSQGTPGGAECLTPSVEEDLHSSDDEFATISVTDELRRLSIDRGNTRFFGKSSGVVLIQTAMDMKKEFHSPPGTKSPNKPDGGTQQHLNKLPSRRPEFWHFEPVGISLSFQVY